MRVHTFCVVEAMSAAGSRKGVEAPIASSPFATVETVEAMSDSGVMAVEDDGLAGFGTEVESGVEGSHTSQISRVESEGVLIETLANEKLQKAQKRMIKEIGSAIRGPLFKLSKTIEKAQEEKVEGDVMKALNHNAEFQNVKVASSEMRQMYSDLDLSESIRMIETAITVYNSSASGLDWLSEIVQREGSKLEKKERERLSREVMGGLVEKKDVPTIVQTKLRMAYIGAAQHIQAQIEEFNGFKKLDEKRSKNFWTLSKNMEYFKDFIVPHQLKQLSPFVQLRGEWTADNLLELYYGYALHAAKLEQKFIPDYGSVRPLEQFIYWDKSSWGWAFKKTATVEELDRDWKAFQSQELPLEDEQVERGKRTGLSAPACSAGKECPAS